MIKPDRNFYTFSSTYYALNGGFAGHNIESGAFTVEALVNLSQRRKGHACNAGTSAFLIEAGGVKLDFVSWHAEDYYKVYIQQGAAIRDYPVYLNMADLDILHIVIEGTHTQVLFDGQAIIDDLAGALPDFTGANITAYIASVAGETTHDICALKLWNYPAGSLPVGYSEEIKRRVMNPWGRSTVLDPGGTALKLEYLLTVEDSPSSTHIVNSANPGVGDLAITPAGNFGDVVKEYALAPPASYESKVRFTSTGADIDPVITVAGTPNIMWKFGDGSLAGSANPGLIDFRSAATRNHSLQVNDWGAVTQLDFNADNLTELDNLELLTALTVLYCRTNNISVLDVTALTALTYLRCDSNSISVLDVTALTALTTLYCRTNNISVLDVTALTALTYLSCSDNSISVLDVTALTALTVLYCHTNNISVLDVTLLVALTDIRCNDNAMNSGAVDNVLVALDTNGLLNGTCHIQNNAVPGAPGAAAKANLIGKGWAVTTD